MSTPTTSRCWAEIDCEALRHNARVVREQIGPDAAILAVVKADGYGHGMVPVARELLAGGEVAIFGVANVAEAARLQADLPRASISILSPALPEEREEVVRRGLVPWISSREEAQSYAFAAEAVRGVGGAPFDLEIKVDTGMGRMGVLEDELPGLLEYAGKLTAIRVIGVLTHLPVADEDGSFTREQMARFGSLAGGDLRVPRVHAQNSAGLIGYDRAGCNVVRAGLMLYGSSPVAAFQPRLRPVLTLKTRVALVRDLPAGRGISYGRTFVTPRPMRVGTLAAGYADGYPRHLSNAGADVLVRGRRCPLLGRVTMDQIMVDLSEVPEAEAGETVTLIGAQGGEEIRADELAAKSGTIAWEIFTGLTPRVARYYLNLARPLESTTA